MTQTINEVEASESPAEPKDVLLEIKDLSVDYLTPTGAAHAVDSVNITLRRGEIIGLAGESGSGKSTLITSVLRLQRPPAVTSKGQVILYHDGKQTDLVTRSDRQLRSLRWNKIAVVMQSAMEALNPVMRLGKQFTDTLRSHYPKLKEKEALERAAELLNMVGIPEDRLDAYPHEMSGGMRQRSLIALALACDPDVVIMDEPTTAVDVVMQRTILGQVLKLQRKLGFAVIFVTHDLSLLVELADRIAIMYSGRVVEYGTAEEIYRSPKHPYTKALRDSFPPLRSPLRKLKGLPGTPPNLRDLPQGCNFAPRCPRKFADCEVEDPAIKQVGTAEVACLLYENSEATSLNEIDATANGAATSRNTTENTDG